MHISENTKDFFIEIEPGHPVIVPNGAFLINKDQNDNISSIIYNFSIKANLRSAIIKGVLFLRNRREGDSYFYGGMTHKLKKMLIDAKIPRDLRDRVPVLADDNGVVWVPGFGVRDDGGGARLYASLYYGDGGFYVRNTQRQIKKKGANT
jgi:tRNA(Ile)-lysidine synthetase-like protein